MLWSAQHPLHDFLRKRKRFRIKKKRKERYEATKKRRMDAKIETKEMMIF